MATLPVGMAYVDVYGSASGSTQVLEADKEVCILVVLLGQLYYRRFSVFCSGNDDDYCY